MFPPPLSCGCCVLDSLKGLSTLIFAMTQRIDKLSAEWLGPVSPVFQPNRVWVCRYCPGYLKWMWWKCYRAGSICPVGYCVRGFTKPNKKEDVRDVRQLGSTWWLLSWGGEKRHQGHKGGSLKWWYEYWCECVCVCVSQWISAFSIDVTTWNQG